MEGSMTSMKDLVQIFASLLTPIIAMTVAYIAWQQYKTNARRLRMEIFDRRFELYDAVRKLRSKVIWNQEKFSDRDLAEFHSTILPARFIVSPQVTEFLSRCEENAKRLLEARDEIQDLRPKVTNQNPNPENWTALNKEDRDIVSWFRQLDNEMNDVFAIDLNLCEGLG